MRINLSHALRTVKQRFLSRSRTNRELRRFGRSAASRHFFEALEDRRLLATLYVDNPGDFLITNDTAPSGLSAGDTVTWNPGAGTQHPTAPVAGLTFGTDAFGTIQSAVDHAMIGDTIRVAGGTFNEAVNITKQLFVLGNQVNADAQAGRPGANETIVDAGGGTDFNIGASDVELNGFTIQGANVNATPYGITLAVGTSGTKITDNIIQNNQAGLSLANNSASDQTAISGNLFLNNNANPTGSISGTAIYADQFTAGGALQNVLINNNTFTNNSNVGVLIGPTDATMGASNITISSNIMTGNGNAILLFNTTNSTIANNEISGSTASQVVIGGGDSGITIHNNFISNGATSGIRIGDFGGGSANSAVTINRNSISGNITAGLNISAGGYTGGAGSLDATRNWWGSSTGPTIASNPGGTGDAIIDPDGVVTYTPFLTSGTDAAPTVRGFQVVLADVGITKTASPSPAVPGTALTYTIVVTNAGPDTVNATVTDAFPAEFNGAVFTSTGVNATGNSASGTGNINDAVTIQSGGSITYTVSGTVAASSTGTLSNTATVTPQTGTQFDNPANNSSTTNTQLTPEADLSVTKSDGVTTAAPGSTHTYTIVVSNSGPSNVTGATVADVFPAASFSSTSFTATGAGGASGFSNSSGTGVQNINQTVSLPVGATITYVVTATVSPTAAGTITNTATVAAPGGTIDANASNNNSTDVDTVAVTASTADLGITKTDGAATATPGGTKTYTIVVSNNGPNPVFGATVVDIFPPTFTGPTFTATTTGGATGATNGSGNLNQTVNLPVGATITYTVTGTVSPTATGAIVNTATVAAPAGVADANAANNVATDADIISPNVAALADLSISKTDGVTTVAPGGTVTYTIVVANTGASAVTGATVSDVFSPQFSSVTFVAAGTTGTSGFTNSPGTGVNNINQTVTIPVGGAITYTVTGTVAATAAGAITNTASVATPAGVVDVNASNNVATDADTVAATATTAELIITKTDNVTTVAAGDSVTYGIVVQNTGPGAATGVRIIDIFPPTLTGVSCNATGSGSAPTGETSGPGNIDQTVNMPANSTITYVCTATVSPTATGAIVNSASVTAPPGVTDPTPTNNVATDIDTVTPAALPQTDLSITKTDAATSVSPNSPVTYVIVVSNNGTSTVTGASVTDIFPATLTGVSFTSTGSTGTSGNTASGTGNIFDTVTLPAGGTITYTVTATTSANATGTISNTATVTPPPTVADVNLTNNTATDIDTVTGTPVVADLGIFKTDGVATVTPGGNVTYTILVTNSGPNAVAGATVADTFPGSLTNVTFTASGTGGASGFTNGAGNINQSVNLPAGATITYTVNATVSPTAPSGATITNTATVSAPAGVTDANAVNNSSMDTDTVVTTSTATTDLSVFKTDGLGTVAPGQTVVYTITVSNLGTTDVNGATLTDVLSPNMTFDSSVSPAGWTPSTTGNVTTFTSTTPLPAGGTATFTVTATVNANAAGAVTNTAAIAAPTGTADTNAANNVSSDTDIISTNIAENTVDLSINKSDGSLTAVPGSTITYTIVVANTGPSAANGAVVSDVFPPNFTGVTFTASGSPGTSGFSGGNGNINQTVNLPASGSITYTVTGTVSASSTGAIANTATVTAPADVTETNPANNSSTDIDTLTPNADLSITKTDGVATAVPGTHTTYTIVVANMGPSDVTGATVTDNFDPAMFGNVTFTAAGSGGASGFSSNTALGHNNINQTVNLPVGATITYTVTATISPGATGNLVNTATVTAPAGTTEINTQNNSSTDTDTLTPQADVSVAKTDTPDPVTAGQNITYTITVTNPNGPSSAQGVTLTDIVPANTTFVSFVAPAGWTVTSPTVGGTGTITATDTAPLTVATSTATFTLVVNVNSTTAGGTTITNTATVATTSTDTNTANDTATATTTVNAATTIDVGVTKVDTPDPVAAGQNITYTITLTNSGTGAAAANSVTLTDIVPANTTFVSFVAPTGWSSTTPTGGGTGTVSSTNTTAPIAAGGTAVFTLIVNVNGATPNNTTITNTATITATGDTNANNNSATATTTVTAVTLPQVDLSVTKTDGVSTVDIGGSLTYTIVVSNNGPSAANGAIVTDTFPATLTNVNFTASGTGGASDFDTSGSGNINDTVNLPAGATITYIVTAAVSPSATPGSMLTNTVTVAPPTTVTDTNPGNNSATDTDTVTPPNVENTPDVSVTKTEDQDTVVAGDNLTYTITVSNISTNPAQNVTLSDAIPADTTFVSFTAPAGWTTSTPVVGGTGTIVAMIPTLAAGATATFTLVVNVNSTAFGGEEISNTAVVTSSTAETTLTNNSSTVTATVEQPAGLPECDIFTANEPGDLGTAMVVDDADNPGDSVLVVTGTNKSDVIVVEAQPRSQGVFRVVQNKHVIVSFISRDVQHIVIFGLAGNDKIVISPALTQSAIVFGDAGNDVITAGSGNTQVSGGDGNDKIVGGRGSDTLCGDNGNDVIVGGLGNDVIFGEAGNDVINGGLGDDLLLGGDGNDVLDGAVGNDHLYGQAGNDTLVGGLGNNVLVGGDGNDKLVARPGRNILIGGNGADTITGSAGDDIEIAGSTAYDEDDAALQSILDEWSSHNSYSTRVSNIRNGGGANGAFVLDDTTVFDDGVRDTLIGSAGLDWFWIGLNDKIKDRKANEQVN
jgi:uncharacterized repeat protein (TIGR01451 family)